MFVISLRIWCTPRVSEVYVTFLCNAKQLPAVPCALRLKSVTQLRCALYWNCCALCRCTETTLCVTRGVVTVNAKGNVVRYTSDKYSE